MSANFLPKTHIDALVTAALWWGDPDRGFRYHHGGPRHVTRENATRVGRMLWQANWDWTMGWVDPADYDDEDGDLRSELEGYVFEELPGEPNPLLVLRALACYVYQTATDEPDVWRTGEAATFVDYLQAQAVRRLPGIETMPWYVEQRDAFLRHPAAAGPAGRGQG
ncbi:hypothetical protein CS0771_09460 [Catellatospora sp. IY07-71]|uniref:hypothetical protein n=1 Tax=Catellatospora sp. IY07-71 TaxID=2728827 RepID=UPI001BB45CD5|nr:hypothetical protein [Catellatospora sp. IY07-71]BCJ71402.1 hypothetical protein CS0771_09460 [Catellatospora sp. IY07-71]